MDTIYIQNPGRYLHTRGKDFNILESYSEYSEDELRGLVESTIRGFNSLRQFSKEERAGVTKGEDAHDEPDAISLLLGIARKSLRAIRGDYMETLCVFGKPEIIEAVTQEAEIEIEIPINGHPFLDHDNRYVIDGLKRYRGLDGAIGFDTTGNITGARKIVRPPLFVLDGVGNEIVGVGGSVGDSHKSAAYISNRGVSSIVLSKDGSVMGFFAGHLFKDLTYNHREWEAEQRIRENSW